MVPERRRILKLPAVPLKRDRESSKCKEVIRFYCSSLANPAARLVDETCRRAQVESLKSSRYGECARCSIFKPHTAEAVILSQSSQSTQGSGER
jgi:hypothetical protein